MSFVKFAGLRKKSKSGRQFSWPLPRGTFPVRNLDSPAFAMAHCQPDNPPHSDSRAFKADLRAPVRRCTFAHPAFSASAL